MRLSLAAAALLIAATTLVSAAPPAQAATSPSVRSACSGFSCRFYFSQARTASMVQAGERVGWVAPALVELVCVRIPNPFVRVACGVAVGIPYTRAQRHISNAAAMGGCFVVQAKIGFTVPIKFGAVSADDPYCG
ncbi:hypothetical protein [Herbidospora sp. RD11066]